jgi:hypothetical protein
MRSQYSDWLRARRLVSEFGGCFSSPRHPDRLWGSPIFLSNGCCELFPQGGKQPGSEANH